MKKILLIFVLIFLLAVPASAAVGDVHSEKFTPYDMENLFSGQVYVNFTDDGYDYFTTWKNEILDYPFNYAASSVSFEFESFSSFSNYPELFIIYTNSDGEIYLEHKLFGTSFEYSPPSGCWISGFSFEIDSGEGYPGTFRYEYIETDPVLYVPDDGGDSSELDNGISNTPEDLKYASSLLKDIFSEIWAMCKKYWILMYCLVSPLVFTLIVVIINLIRGFSDKDFDGINHKNIFFKTVSVIDKKIKKIVFKVFRFKKKYVLVTVDGVVYKKKYKKKKSKISDKKYKSIDKKYKDKIIALKDWFKFDIHKFNPGSGSNKNKSSPDSQSSGGEPLNSSNSSGNSSGGSAPKSYS